MNSQQAQPIENKSMVAVLMAQIQDAYTASKRAIDAYSEGTAKHEFITARAEMIANVMISLSEKHGDEMVMMAMRALPPDEKSNVSQVAK